MNDICCEKCEHYCRVLDYKNRYHGRVCDLWLDGIAGSADWFCPDIKCFKKIKQEQNEQTN